MNALERDQRLWFIVGELDPLGAIDGLKDALARLRTFVRRQVSRGRGTLFSKAQATATTATTADHYATEDAVMASEIEQLPDLKGLSEASVAARVAAGPAGDGRYIERR
jgi:Type IV secretion-system coupling protein DNA-binding domain